jgi:uncharacterized membrane protein YjgN (DUF898 family)
MREGNFISDSSDYFNGHIYSGNFYTDIQLHFTALRAASNVLPSCCQTDVKWEFRSSCSYLTRLWLVPQNFALVAVKFSLYSHWYVIYYYRTAVNNVLKKYSIKLKDIPFVPKQDVSISGKFEN